MRRFVVCLSIAIVFATSLHAQTPAAAPQSPRQALLEMFFSKTPGTFVKHLPMATRTALEKSGALATLQQYSLMAAQFQAQGQNVQTFETGPVLLAGENPTTGQKVEITLANETLRGDRDDIELSFQVYKNGQAQRTPFMPQMTFSMQQEAQVWTLNEVSLTIHVPLADPDVLKAFAENMRSPALANARLNSSAATSMQSAADSMVVAAMRTIVAAEASYAKNYPAVGFTCTLSNLDGFGGGQTNERQAMLINSGLASGKRYGFVFTLSGCTGTPATAFHLTAAAPNFSGRKIFCTDQSDVIRSSDDGNLATCLASGTPVQ